MRALRLLSRRRRGQFRLTALWAMVPLALVNGWPAVGCICADGRFSSNCPMLQSASAEVTRESCCKADCCATAEPAAVKSCCETAADSRHCGADDETGCRVNRKGCCHLVVHAGELPTLLAPVQVTEGHQTPALVSVSAWQCVNPSHALGHATFVENDTGQLSSDLVITLRRLVI